MSGEQEHGGVDSVRICARHPLLEFKIDEQKKSLDALDTKISAILTAVNKLENRSLQVATHDVVLFGENMSGGLLGKIKDLEDDRSRRNKIWAGILTFIGGNIAFLWSLAMKKGGQ